MADHDSRAPVRLRLSGDDARVLIEVWDADPRSLAPGDPGADGLPDLEAEGGRGLFLRSQPNDWRASSSHSWWPNPEVAATRQQDIFADVLASVKSFARFSPPEVNRSSGRYV